MERICQVCNQSKKTPYRDMCRGCYQKRWAVSVLQKICEKCTQPFSSVGKTCRRCYANERNKQSRSITCSKCKRVGLVIRNRELSLCTKCDRQEKEAANPSLAEKRRTYLMEYSRKKRGSDPNAPKRESKGWWKSRDGYVILYKANHANSNVNGCVFEHTFIMSEALDRPLTKDETVHHINGVRDDNRIENLELWSNSHPPGQRVEDKLKWAKEILMKYSSL